MSAQHDAVVDSDNKSRSSQIIIGAGPKPTRIIGDSLRMVSNTNDPLSFLNQDSEQHFDVLEPTAPDYSLPKKPEPQLKIHSNWWEDDLSEPTPPSTSPRLSNEPSGQLDNLDQEPMFTSRYNRIRSLPLCLSPVLFCSRRQEIEVTVRSNSRIGTTFPTHDGCQQRDIQLDNDPQNSKSPSDQTTLLLDSPVNRRRSLGADKTQAKTHVRPLYQPSEFKDSPFVSKKYRGEEMKMSWEVTQIMEDRNRNRCILTIIAPLTEESNRYSQKKARIKIKKQGTKFPLVTKNLEISKISKVNKCPDGRRLVIFFSFSTNRDRKVLDVKFSSNQQQEDCLQLLRNLNSYFFIQKKALRLPPRWDPDNKATNCAICDSKFNVLTNRKHHCRMCGKCVCSNCSRTEAVLPEYGFETPVRVDVRCYEAILREKLGSRIGGLGLKNRTSGSSTKTSGDPCQPNELDFHVVTSKVQTPKNTVRNKKHSANSSAWKKYLAQNHTLNRNSKQLQKRISRGIPPEYRGHIWTTVSGCFRKRHAKPDGYYSQLLDYAERHKNDLPFLSDLEKDLHRPMQEDLKTIYNNQDAMQMLRRVLIAYAIRNSKVGYCQSMNFICALVLLFTKEEDAFWLLCYIIEDICCVDKQFYYHSKELEGWIIDQCVFTVMVEKMLPELSRHLADLHIPTSALSDNWFLCLFVNNLPLRTTLRLWDLMFLNGIDAIFRGALAILMINKERALKTRDLESLLKLFKDTVCRSRDNDSLNTTDIDNEENDAFIEVCYNHEISSTLDQLHSLRVFHRAHIEQYARTKNAQKSNNVRTLGSDRSTSRFSSLAPLAYIAKPGSWDDLLIPTESTALHEVSSLHDLPESNNKLNEQEKDKLANMDGRMIYMDPAYRKRFQEFSQYFGRIETNTSRVEEYFGVGTSSNVQCQESPVTFPEPEASYFKEGLNSSSLPRNNSFPSLYSSSKDSPFSLVEFKGCLPANLEL